jgi:peptidyl-prolyl cis-trans isomerase C
MRREKMSRASSLALGSVALACCLLFLAVQGSRAGETSSVEARKLAARVNGAPIYEDQLTVAVEASLQKLRRRGARNVPPERVRALRGDALDRAIGEELVRQESQKLVVEGADEKVDEKLAAFRKGFASEEQFESYLRRHNLTPEGLRASMRERVQIEAYLAAKGLEEPHIPEQQIRAAYERHPERYSREETVGVRHILISVDGSAGSEEKKKALREAAAIREEILAGGDFADLARKHSDCSSAPDGGNLGSIRRGYMPEPFQRVAFAMEVGSISEVVETEFGYHIIQVYEKNPAGVAPYEDVREFIEKFLQQRELDRLLAAHVAELRERAEIETFAD